MPFISDFTLRRLARSCEDRAHAILGWPLELPGTDGQSGMAKGFAMLALLPVNLVIASPFIVSGAVIASRLPKHDEMHKAYLEYRQALPGVRDLASSIIQNTLKALRRKA